MTRFQSEPDFEEFVRSWAELERAHAKSIPVNVLVARSGELPARYRGVVVVEIRTSSFVINVDGEELVAPNEELVVRRRGSGRVVDAVLSVFQAMRSLSIFRS